MIKGRVKVLAAIVSVLAVVPSGRASASIGNDNFADATVIDSLPFSIETDLSSATVEEGEPATCRGERGTVWFRFVAPADIGLNLIIAIGSKVGIYEGPSLDALAYLGCSSDYIRARAGRTYYLQAGVWHHESDAFELEILPTPIPPNDDVGDAIWFGSVPFADQRPERAASASEPFGSFAYRQGCATTYDADIWYRYTPAPTAPRQETLIVNTTGSVGPGLVDPTVHVWAGRDQPEALVACSGGTGEPVGFDVFRDQTYWFMVSLNNVGRASPQYVRFELAHGFFAGAPREPVLGQRMFQLLVQTDGAHVGLTAVAVGPVVGYGTVFIDPSGPDAGACYTAWQFLPAGRCR